MQRYNCLPKKKVYLKMLKYLALIFFQAGAKKVFRQPVQAQLETFVQIRRNRAG